MIDKSNTVVCFSGHRSYVAAPGSEARLRAALQSAWDDGYRTFVSGMAPGFDLAAAEGVVGMRSAVAGVRLIAAIPFAGQSRGYSSDDRARYEALLAAADRVEVLADGYSRGCYYRRDDWMVRRSGRIVCWYDGSSGGTRYTVRRAVAAGLEVVNIFRAAGELFQ